MWPSYFPANDVVGMSEAGENCSNKTYHHVPWAEAKRRTSLWKGLTGLMLA